MRDVACSDCVVSTLLNLTRAPESAEEPAILNTLTEVSEETVEAISLLSSRGIVRPMRFQVLSHG